MRHAGCGRTQCPVPFTPRWGQGHSFILPRIPFIASAPPMLLFANVFPKVQLMASAVASLSHLSCFTGANCLGRTPVGRTPLHVAAAMGQWDCIKLLLKYGASVNSKDAKGMTPVAVSLHLDSKHSARQYKLYKMFPWHWVRKSERKGPTGMHATKAFPRVTSGSGSKKSKAELPLGLSARQS